MTTNQSPSAPNTSEHSDPAASQAQSGASEVRQAAGPGNALEENKAPAPPPGPALDRNMEQLLLSFYSDPTRSPELTDGASALPGGVADMLASISEWAHRLAGSGLDLQALDAQQQELLHAVVFFVNRVLLAPKGNHYRVLGLSADASSGDVHDHYRYLRRLFSIADPEGQAHGTVMRVSEAYVVLRDPARRRAYNASVLGKAAPAIRGEDGRGRPLLGAGESRRGATRDTGGGRSRLWFGAGAATVLVLSALWWWGGSDNVPQELAVAPPAPIAETTAPEVETIPSTSVSPPPLAQTGAGQADEALLERVEEFAEDGAQDFAATAPSAPESQPASETSQPEAEPSAQAESTSEVAAVEVPPGVEQPPEPAVAVIPVLPPATSEAAAASETPVVQADPRIGELLARAERQLAAGQLTTPAGNSAVDSYEDVLRLDPDNERAQEGVNNIADRYAMLARYRLRRDELVEARDMVDRGLRVVPGHPPLLDAQAAINTRAAALDAALVAAGSSRDQEPDVGVAAAAVAAGAAAATTTRPPSTAGPSTEATAATPSTITELAASDQGTDSRVLDQSEVSAAPRPAAQIAAVTPPPSVAAPASPAVSEPDPRAGERQLDALVDRFVSLYEAGDLEGFMALFSEDAQTNSRNGAKAIRQDYRSLFEGSQSRLMRVKDLRWSRSDGEAVGEADFNLSVFGRRDSRPSAYNGRLTFRVVEVDGKYLIKGLFHSQRKLDD